MKKRAGYHLPEELHKKVMMEAADKGIRASHIVEKALLEYFEKGENNLLKVIEIVELKENFPIDGENYTVGKAEDGRYFFAWGSYIHTEEVPAREIRDGEEGIEYFRTNEEAMKAMNDAMEAVNDGRG